MAETNKGDDKEKNSSVTANANTEEAKNAGPTPTAEPAKQSPSAAPKDKKVEVPESQLKELLATVKTLEDRDKARETELKRLQYAADKGRLAHYDAKSDQSGELIRTEYIGTWQKDDKALLILGWKVTRNEVYVETGTGKVIENQRVKLFLHDPEKDQSDESGKSEVEITYSEFFKLRERILCNVMKVAEDKVNKTILHTLQLPDGQVFELDVMFVNP